MISNAALQQLHDRATRGESLSPEERSRLERWYAEQDRDEAAVLIRNVQPDTIRAIRDQIDVTVAELRRITEQIQAITAENSQIRQQIADMQAEFVRKAPAGRA